MSDQPPPIPPTAYLVYYHPNMRNFADLVMQSGKKLGRTLVRKEITWAKFSGGMPNIFVHDIEQVRSRHVLFLASFSCYEEMSIQLDVIYMLTRSLVASMTVVLPYWPVGTMERVIREGEVASADIWAWHFSKLPITSGGPTRVVLYDVHALSNRFFFHDGAIAVLLSGIPLLIKELKENEKFKNEEISITFPDAGACKRFGNMFPNYDLITCEKVRDGDKRIVRIADGNPKGKHCVIVDDLVRSGGTLLECHAGLIAAGAVKVSAYCTHADFDYGKHVKRFLGDETPFDTFFLTNSHPFITDTIPGDSVFHVLDISEDLLNKIH